MCVSFSLQQMWEQLPWRCNSVHLPSIFWFIIKGNYFPGVFFCLGFPLFLSSSPFSMPPLHLMLPPQACCGRDNLPQTRCCSQCGLLVLWDTEGRRSRQKTRSLSLNEEPKFNNKGKWLLSSKTSSDNSSSPPVSTGSLLFSAHPSPEVINDPSLLQSKHRQVPCIAPSLYISRWK